MEMRNYRSLWMGTLFAFLTLLITSYIYYNVINNIPVDNSGWVFRILFTLFFSFALSYLFWRTTLIRNSPLLTGIVIGTLASILIVSASQMMFLHSNETIICCQGNHCWVWVGQTILAAAMMSLTGRTGGGSDD